MAHRRPCLVWLVLLVATLAPSVARGQECATSVPGGVVVGQTWTAEQSPYCVTGDITVTGLSIDPGVHVLIDGPYEIDVLSISAIGTGKQPIRRALGAGHLYS